MEVDSQVSQMKLKMVAVTLNSYLKEALVSAVRREERSERDGSDKLRR